MLKKLLGRAAAGLLAGTLLLSAMPAACAIEQEALSQPVEIPYADRFDGRTLAEIMADFMAENGVGEDNFALSYYNTVTGERYDFNEDIPEWNDEGTISNEERVLITQSMKEVNQIMESYVGIVRSNTRLTRAWNRLDILYEETEKLFKSSKATRELCELRNMINVGYLITRQAMERKESRGLHYTIDYPHAQK